jgi:ATP-dependent Clp protease protease subunit
MTIKSEDQIHNVHSYGVNLVTREIYLHSAYDSGREIGVDYRSAITFIKNLHLLESSSKNVLVHMHTVGGDWNDGMAIYNAIRHSPCPVTILAYAQASSMSGIMLQAADKRVLMPDCEFLIHNGSIAIDGTAAEAKAMVESNEANSRRMMEVFAWRAANGPHFIKAKMNNSQIIEFIDRKVKDKSDWAFSAKEALNYGFCDGVLGMPGFEDLKVIRKVRKDKTIR